MMIQGMPEWLHYLVRGLMLCATLCFFAVTLTRMGRNPYWALLAVLPIPFLIPAALWLLAYMPWKGDAVTSSEKAPPPA